MAPRLELDRRTLRLMAIAFVLLAGLTIHRLWLAPTPDALEVLEVSGETMGTTYHLRIAGSGLDDRLRARVEQETARRLDDVDRSAARILAFAGLEHAAARRPAVDVIAQHDQKRPGMRPGGEVGAQAREHGVEQVESAVHVADGIDPLPLGGIAHAGRSRRGARRFTIRSRDPSCIRPARAAFPAF